ncbi:MAG TPA: class I SAM-dependent methyltransferase [bacterium]|nr:class I SAM-dependent methyltransferase [bacterium]
MIIDRHRGKERLPAYEDYIADDLGGPNSRVDRFERELYPEIRFHCGDLQTRRVLDFGCGTGSTTAMLALHCERLVAFDINEHSVAICTRRLEEHGLLERVQVLCARNFTEIAKDVGPFDLILVNAVVEHIPLSIAGLRRKIFVELFDALAPGGSLFINETPNRFWPVDLHTTGLWWIPWSTPGSPWAYRTAVKAGRHVDNPSAHSDGPLGLEERGAWGATFFEIAGYLSGRRFRVVNTLRGHNRHISYGHRIDSRKRQAFEFLVYHAITRWARIPIVALAPMLSNLVIQKAE